MNTSHMLLEPVQTDKTRITIGALERFFACVISLMSYQSRLGFQLLVTVPTLELWILDLRERLH